MKKVGITTFYNAYNYGAFLQTFALQKALEKKYDVTNIAYTCNKIKKDYKLIKTNNLKKLIKSIIFIFPNLKRKNKFNWSVDKYIKLSNLDDSYDCVIAGSDQIWNIKLTGGYDKVYSLEYFNDIKKISYASSVGDETLISKNKEQYKKILSNIDIISVREESAKKELEKLTKKDIKVNLDPTLLLSKEEWDSYTLDNEIKEPYIFSYFVGVTEDNYNFLNKLTNNLGMKTLSYSENPKEKNILKKCFTDDPFEFISRIKYADLVFVSSFHGTVFSIIFNKQFYCMPPKDKGNRIINLLNKLGLSSRIVSSDDIDKIDVNKKIDYVDVNKKLKELRNDSLEWLEKALGD